MEVGKKPPKKEMDNPSFLWRLMADFFRHFLNHIMIIDSVDSYNMFSLSNEFFIIK